MHHAWTTSSSSYRACPTDLAPPALLALAAAAAVTAVQRSPSQYNRLRVNPTERIVVGIIICDV